MARLPDAAQPPLGVLAGTDMTGAQLAEICRRFETILAADGGADVLLAAGVTPGVVIGDFDSVSLAGRQRSEGEVWEPDQDSSDCDKLLRWVEGRGYSSVTLTNVEGDRPDHFLATLSSCVRSSLEIDILFRRGRGLVGAEWPGPVGFGGDRGYAFAASACGL